VVFYGTFAKTHPKPVMKRHADIIDINKKIRLSKPVPTQGLTKTMLVDIVIANFRCSELTIWKQYIESFRQHRKIFNQNETVLFISMTGHLLLWIVGETRINDDIVLDTRKWRLHAAKGTGKPSEVWDSSNVLYYASQVGLSLILPNRQTVGEYMRGGV
jgi:hypothetical protein